ncbi:MAG: D-lyxose/D-mannose family sugar isomerase [Rhodopila sp.]|nr:D-lyxose/D-mannose family sugar isomerase [Rhodopila sp.]
MRRSEINDMLRDATARMAAHGFALPPWAHWSSAEWRTRADVARHCVARQIGWDVTDFGSGRFAERGLLLLCLRNGRPGGAAERSYAEKIMVMREGQETPWHHHRVKMEDIIVRGGGNLVIEFAHRNAEGTRDARDVTVMVDETAVTIAAATPLILCPGSSVTLPQGLDHRFYGQAGHGPVLVGEVSVVNDDLTDNYFLDDVGRFAALEEDELPLYPLWSDLRNI